MIVYRIGLDIGIYADTAPIDHLRDSLTADGHGPMVQQWLDAVLLLDRGVSLDVGGNTEIGASAFPNLEPASKEDADMPKAETDITRPDRVPVDNKVSPRIPCATERLRGWCCLCCPTTPDAATQADKIEAIYRSRFGVELFNLYTLRRESGLIFSKRCQVVRAMLDAMLTAEFQSVTPQAGE